MKQPKPVCVDFETFGIEGRPSYPPIPVGVSIKLPGKKAEYLAWGHPSKNNCTQDRARSELETVWGNSEGLLFQNAKFDIDVAEVHLKLKAPAWDKIHDSMFLLFLDDPHQLELSLKPSAERLLGLKPEEQDAVADWLIANQPVPDVKISRSKGSEHYFGRYIALAPGDIVGKYANGDTVRTEKLFNLLWKKTRDRKMLEAYDRERRLMPILLEMERQGVPVNDRGLRADVAKYNGWRQTIDQWIIKTLKADPEINLDSGEQLVNAMIFAGHADPDLIPLTPTGKFQTNKEALLLGVTHKPLLAVLKYRTQLNTCMNTFMEPWLKTSTASGGLIFTTWNQVKSPSGDRSVGTRTGRLSSTPNFQNIPLSFQPIFKHEKKGLPKAPFALPPLPNVRSYIVPFKGELLCGRDFSSQELRVLAHFENGKLLQAYAENPALDLHQHIADLITKTLGIFISRKDAKTIAFSILYGSGIGKLAISLGCSVDQAQLLKNAYLKTLPGVKALIADLTSRAHQKLPIRTIGGREYYCEEPKFIDGRLRNFSYKMINYIIQSSSADLTKDAVLRFHAVKSPGKLLLSVHDEIVISVAKSKVKETMEALRIAMEENTGLDVPMRSDGEIGPNWAEMKSEAA